MLTREYENQYKRLKEIQHQHDLKDHWDDEDWAFDEVLNYKLRECIRKMYGGATCN